MSLVEYRKVRYLVLFYSCYNYVNDMASAVRCRLLLYADDSALIVSGKNVADINQR